MKGSIDGVTPFWMAVLQGHLAVVKVLLRAGANIEQCMIGNGWTPLIVAALCGHAPVVEALLGAGANAGAATTAEHSGVPAGTTAAAAARR